MIEFGVTPEFVASLYEAALDPQDLRPIASLLAGLLRVDSVGVWVNENGRISDMTLAVADTESQKSYLSYYRMLDVWPSGERFDKVVLGSKTIPGSRLASYDGVARRCGLSTPISAAIGLSPGAIAVIGLQRPQSGPRSGEVDKRPLQAVLPHLKRALQLRLRSRPAARAMQPGFALEAMAFGAVICNRQGHVLYANSAARTLARNRVGVVFRQRDHVLGALTTPESQRLWRLIEDAAISGRAGSMVLTDRDGLQSLIALVTPLPNGVGCDYGPGHALVAIRQAGGGPVFSAARLKELFRLSPAQAALAIALYEGRSFEDIASERGVKVTTLRTHFSEILIRTGSKSLRDMVRLLGTIPPLL